MEQKTSSSPNPAIQFVATHTGPAEHPILRLQRTAGNQAILRWLRPGGGKKDTPPESNGDPKESGNPEAGVAETETQSEAGSNRIWPAVIPVIMIVACVAYFCYQITMR